MLGLAIRDLNEEQRVGFLHACDTLMTWSAQLERNGVQGARLAGDLAEAMHRVASTPHSRTGAAAGTLWPAPGANTPGGKWRAGGSILGV